MKQSETLILGIGNTLLSDEGAGIHALNHLQEKLQSSAQDTSNITFIDGGTLSFMLAVWIEDCDNLIVFDAAQLKQAAGSVKTFVGEEMDEFLGNSKCSAHEVGLLDLMDMARITDHLPEQRAVIGIQPDYMGWGMQPTASVAEALNKATDEAIILINAWQSLDANRDASEQTEALQPEPVSQSVNNNLPKLRVESHR